MFISFFRKGLILLIVFIAGAVLLLKKTGLTFYYESRTKDYSKESYLEQESLNLDAAIHPVSQVTELITSNSPAKSQVTENITTNSPTTSHFTKIITSNPPTVHPVTEDVENLKYSHNRYVLAYSYWEQQTNALINMWTLQKWADKSGARLKVVEPFAANSVLEFPHDVLYKHRFTNALRFRDYFDLGYWTTTTGELGIEPLVSWDTFVKYANRNVILAIPSYGAHPPGVHVDSEIDKIERCRFDRDKITHNIESLLKILHFEIIKVVCFAISSGYVYTFNQFNSFLIPNSNATIWFGYWEGIGRVPINDATLQRDYGKAHVFSMIHPSPQLMIASRKYAKTVLKADFRKYTAIAFRTVQVRNRMKARGRSANYIMDYFTNCIGKLEKILDKLGSKSFFFTSDMGRFGDYTGNQPSGTVDPLLQHALKVVYGNKTNDVYESEFIQAANGIDDRGYIASMQRAIAENANCLIVMGGYSSFQKSMVINYKKSDQFNCVKYICYDDLV